MRAAHETPAASESHRVDPRGARMTVHREAWHHPPGLGPTSARSRHDGRCHRHHRQAGLGRSVDPRSRRGAGVLRERLPLADRGEPRPAVRRLRPGEGRRPRCRGDRWHAVARPAGGVVGVHRQRRCRCAGAACRGRRRHGRRPAIPGRRPGTHGRLPGPDGRVHLRVGGRPDAGRPGLRQRDVRLGGAQRSRRRGGPRRSTSRSSAGRRATPARARSAIRSSSWAATASRARSG